MERWTSQALAVPPPPSWQRADLEFEGVEHDGASFVLHVFLNNHKRTRRLRAPPSSATPVI
jgi:hypothetical protein